MKHFYRIRSRSEEEWTCISFEISESQIKECPEEHYNNLLLTYITSKAIEKEVIMNNLETIQYQKIDSELYYLLVDKNIFVKCITELLETFKEDENTLHLEEVSRIIEMYMSNH